MIRGRRRSCSWNFLNIRMDSRKAEGMRFTMIRHPDNGENSSGELANATLTNIISIFLGGET